MVSSTSCLAIWSTVLFLIAVFGWVEEVTGQCLEYQKSLLLNLDQNLKMHVNYIVNPIVFSQWDYNKDCCGWPGVTCNNNGHVIGLDLADKRFALNNSSPLFHLQHLTTLNLAGNEFQLSTDMSSGFERLVNLMNLNLSYVYFLGRFPGEISNLTRLVSLDLSWSSYNGHVDYEGLIGNLSKLAQLHLGGNEYLRLNHEWPKFMSSSLPHLRDLKLNFVELPGPIDNSFQNLTFLSILDLSDNHFGTPIPTLFSKFNYLTSLNLANSEFQGDIPSSLTNLTSLTYLDLSSNNLSGLIPSFSRTINLKYLALGNNQLTGSIQNTNWGDLSQLEYLGVQFNSLNGIIPSSLFGIPALLRLDVSSNRFTNFTDEHKSIYSSQLRELNLANNDLYGPFPSILYSLRALRYVDLEFNNFSGTFCMDCLQEWRNLTGLVISYNNLIVDFGEELLELPRLKFVGMVSCKLKVFPAFLKRKTMIIYLDISANQIQGEVPKWIWSSLGSVHYLNFSHNHLQTFEAQADDTPYCNAQVVDLSYNKLHGKIPILLPQVGYLDLSHNCFDSMVFTTLNTSSISFLSVSNNFLEGRIPKLLCNSTSLEALDMSSNFLSGTLPSCLLQMETLSFLSLKSNTIRGIIPDTLPLNCGLMIINLNGNSLEGTIPKSFGNCKGLSRLDLGDNELHDVFPCWMSNISELGVLVLKSNKLQGSTICPGSNITWPRLHILDISSNNLSGNLPSQQFLSWEAMLAIDQFVSDGYMISISYNYLLDDDIVLPPKFKRIEVNVSDGHYGTTLVLKGTNAVVPSISSGFKLINLSNNKFEGIIPDELGYFIALHQLNISHNKLVGQIPSSLGRMKNLESLDLRNNELSGNIPSQLANLNFLSVLNLSFNKLEGKIPNGGQFQTFSEYSFLHNEGLCGFPLNTSCDEKIVSTKLSKQSPIINGEVLISAEVGYAVGLGFIIMPLIFWTGWRRRFYEFTDRMLLKILCR